MAGPQAQIVVAFDGSVLATRELTAGESFTVGDDAHADLALEGIARLKLVRAVNDGCEIAFIPPMNGAICDGRQVTSFAALIESGAARRCADPPDSYAVHLAHGTRAVFA